MSEKVWQTIMDVMHFGESIHFFETELSATIIVNHLRDSVPIF